MTKVYNDNDKNDQDDSNDRQQTYFKRYVSVKWLPYRTDKYTYFLEEMWQNYVSIRNILVIITYIDVKLISKHLLTVNILSFVSKFFPLPLRRGW